MVLSASSDWYERQTLGSAFCVYLFLRLLAGAFVLSPFRKEEKKRILRGPIGMVLSLIPATALIFVLGVALWTAGTLFSVEHTKEGVAVQPGSNAVQRPFWARWNYAWERDWIGKVIGKIDPLSARAKGTTCLLYTYDAADAAERVGFGGGRCRT